LDDQGAMNNDANLLGDVIPAPSPRRTTQSHETHQSKQTLQNDANEQVRMCGSPSGSGAASPFDSVQSNDGSTGSRVGPPSTIAEAVLENGLDDGQDNVDLDADARVDLNTRCSNASDEADSTYESGLCGLVTDTKD